MVSNYTGPRGTNDFDDLDPDQATRELVAYKLLGEKLEEEGAAGMNGRGRIGVNLSSRSGFTNTSKVRYHAGKTSRRHCGQYADPGVSGPRNLKITR